MTPETMRQPMEGEATLTIQRGEKVYMPELGDNPKNFMIFEESFGEGWTCMARLRYPNQDRVVTYPMRYVQRVPALEPVDPLIVAMVLLSVVAILCGFIYQTVSP